MAQAAAVLAWSFAVAPALAQPATPSPAATPAAPAARPATALPRVTVASPAAPGPDVGGFSPEPLATTPVQASVLDAERLRDRGFSRLSDVTRVDASISDAYNAPGYWDSLTVRGFVIDNRFNFRRDGLPISAETSIPLDNKQRLEVLEGLAGIQAGSAAPGGLVNLVVKRPTAKPLTEGLLQVEGAGSVLGAVDVSRRFGAGGAVGLRVNAAAERLDPEVRNARGDRWLLAVAGEARLAPTTLLEAEVESSRRSQPSVPGFSLLAGPGGAIAGSRVPAVPDPRINLNNQPWSQPVVFGATTGSLRLTQGLGDAWRLVAHGAVQELVTDDRLAFPYGCGNQAAYVPDRYCSDGSFDLYDYRSEGERRRTAALDVSVDGSFTTGPLTHDTTLGVLWTNYRQRLNRQAYNYVGAGDVTGTIVTPADPSLTDENTQRDERSTELYARHRIAFGPDTRLWLGLRHVRLARESVRTDGSRATSYEQAYTTPWLAVTRSLGPGMLGYASWGEGVQSDVVPGRSRYTNAGQALPARPTRQLEAGLKGGRGVPGAPSDGAGWAVAAFDIRRPLWRDIGSCSAAGSCTRTFDGQARHVGLALDGDLQAGALGLSASLQALRARREGSADATLNGLPPPNVPAASLKAEARWAVAAVPGLTAIAGLTADGSRSATADDSLRIGGFARWDVALRWRQAVDGATLTWRAGVDNVFDRRAWRESPVQFDHTYLYPLAPRTWRLSVQVTPR